MLTFSINFEGGYTQLVKLVNLLDRSPRFLIIEGLQVAPEAKGDTWSRSTSNSTPSSKTSREELREAGRRTEERSRSSVALLLAIVLVVVYMNFFSGDSAAPPPPPRPAVPVAATPAAAPQSTPRTAELRFPRRAAEPQVCPRAEIKFRQGTEPGPKTAPTRRPSTPPCVSTFWLKYRTWSPAEPCGISSSTAPLRRPRPRSRCRRTCRRSRSTSRP